MCANLVLSCYKAPTQYLDFAYWPTKSNKFTLWLFTEKLCHF